MVLHAKKDISAILLSEVEPAAYVLDILIRSFRLYLASLVINDTLLFAPRTDLNSALHEVWNHCIRFVSDVVHIQWT